jgi:hypothetical protein
VTIIRLDLSDHRTRSVVRRAAAGLGCVLAHGAGPTGPVKEKPYQVEVGRVDRRHTHRESNIEVMGFTSSAHATLACKTQPAACVIWRRCRPPTRCREIAMGELSDRDYRDRHLVHRRNCWLRPRPCGSGGEQGVYSGSADLASRSSYCRRLAGSSVSSRPFPTPRRQPLTESGASGRRACIRSCMFNSPACKHLLIPPCASSWRRPLTGFPPWPLCTLGRIFPCPILPAQNFGLAGSPGLTSKTHGSKRPRSAGHNSRGLILAAQISARSR